MHLTNGAKIACALMYACRIFPVKKNKIVFSSFFGAKYNDNPKAISDELLKRKDIQQIWLLPKDVPHPDTIKTVPPSSVAALYHLATAKVWIDNSRKRGYVRKRKSQFYIQTWHGGVGFKSVEGGAVETLKERYIEAAKNDSKMADAFISECEWKTQQYRRDFWYSGEIIKCGMPRSDIFFKDQNAISEKVRSALGINLNKRIVLYAPTFRKDNGMEAYNIDYDRLCDALEKKYGGKWCVVVRLHPEVSSKADFIRYNDRVVNGTVYEDINEILVASQFLISDYSSCIFDALFCKKKVILYAPDIEQYNAEDRHLTFKFDELPMAIARDNDELTHIINTFDDNAFEERRASFIEKMGYYSKGNASKIISNRIISEMGLEG